MTQDLSAIKTEFDQCYNEANSYWAPYITEANADLESYLGKQWGARDIHIAKLKRRSAFVFNKVRRVVHMVSGYQRKHRLSLVVNPVEDSDELTASQLSSVVMWGMQYANGFNVMSDCFTAGALKTGINLLALYVDYKDDPVSGDIKFRRMPHNSFFIDPNTSERDLSDCSWLMYRRYVNKDKAAEFLPDHNIKSIITNADDKFSFLKPHEYQSNNKKLCAIDEFWQVEQRKQEIVINQATEEVIQWHGTGESKMALLSEYGDNFIFDECMVQQMRLTRFINGVPVSSEIDPWGLNELPFVAITGFWDPEYHLASYKLQGLVRCIRDPQNEFNRRRSKMLDIIDSQLASGWKVKEGAVVDPEAMYRTGQGEVVWFNRNASLADAEQIQSAEIPQGLMALTEMLDRDIMEIPGANSELMGMPESDDVQIAGILSKLRQSAGLTILQDLFDNYRLSKKLVGQKMIKLIQANYSAKKIQRIIGEEPSEEFYSRSFGKYDVVPEEGVLTDTQKQLYFSQLLQLQQLGAPISWKSIIDAAPLQNKQKLLKDMQLEEEANNGASEEELKNRALMAELLSANIDKDRAHAEESKSNVMLHKAVAIQKVNDITDIAQLHKLANFVESL